MGTKKTPQQKPRCLLSAIHYIFNLSFRLNHPQPACFPKLFSFFLASRCNNFSPIHRCMYFFRLFLGFHSISIHSEEPMTEVTGFRQSVRLFWYSELCSRVPDVDWEPSPSIILRPGYTFHSVVFPASSVRCIAFRPCLTQTLCQRPYADSPTAVQALKVDSHHGSHASPRYRCFVIWLFPFPECLFTCDRFYPLLG